MKYNFDEVVDRKGTYSCKLDQMPFRSTTSSKLYFIIIQPLFSKSPYFRMRSNRSLSTHTL